MRKISDGDGDGYESESWREKCENVNRIRDTDHSFYLLAGKIMDDSRTTNLQIFHVREQRVHRNFGRHPYIADTLILMLPFGYIK